jgi:hypothetical protein
MKANNARSFERGTRMSSAGVLGFMSVAGACVLIACGPAGSRTRGAGGTGGADPSTPGLHRNGNQLTLRTDRFTLEPQQEKYVCWTTRASEAVKVASFSKAVQPFVHHLVLTTTTNEPDGMRDCDGTFKLGWRPLFAAGAGEVNLAFPDNVVIPINQDAQLQVELHLLNSSNEPVTDSTAVVMNLSDAAAPENALFGVVGNTEVNLPPFSESKVVADCPVARNTRVVGFFPHMHKLGTAMTFDLGPTADNLRRVYARNPFSFHDQRIDGTDMMLEANSQMRLTCSYNNTTPQAVRYGESTYDEMCYLILFVVGSPTACIRGPLPISG